MARQRWIGRWLIGVAAIHTSVALVQHRADVMRVFADGFFNSVAGNAANGAIVWSILFGCVAALGGIAVDALEAHSVAIPKTMGWCFIALGATGAALMPVSGFWLLFPAAFGILRR